MTRDIHNSRAYRHKIWIFMWICIFAFVGLLVRLFVLMEVEGTYYEEKATQLHERERKIKAARGRILDCNQMVLADNRTVCTISVIHNQIQNPETVIKVLCDELDMDESKVRKYVEKRSSMERIKSNVDPEIGNRIRKMQLPGVKVDEDYKRCYPYGELASKVLGFTGSDNQGILGLEAKYDSYLQGSPGVILTMTDAKGIELEEKGERRIDPINGYSLHLTIDYNIQMYATQLASKTLAEKQAERVEIIVMNPQNGGILAMVDVPEFDLNDPYGYQNEELQNSLQTMSQEEKNNTYNAIWRNACINDTYEPGSVFKIVTAAAGLEEGVITPDFHYCCAGSIMVGDRKIRCHKVTGHGSQDFTHCMMNSCNPALITVGLMLGTERYYSYFQHFQLLEKTGIDLSGEAKTIMHKKEAIGPVELATVAFGQSFQLTPIRLITTVSSLINGGNPITPHFLDYVTDEKGKYVAVFENGTEDKVVEPLISEPTSAQLRDILEKVVSEGTGKNGKVEGYRIGGKTATSQTLPRGSGKYIASYLGFAPADDPRVIAIAIIHNPQGTYYGGQVAAPVIGALYENILPYLGLEKEEIQTVE